MCCGLDFAKVPKEVGGAFGGGGHGCALLRREGVSDAGLHRRAVPVPRRHVRARVPPAFPRREAEGDGAPATEGSRQRSSWLRQKIAVVPALLAGLADPPPVTSSAGGFPPSAPAGAPGPGKKGGLERGRGRDTEGRSLGGGGRWSDGGSGA